MRPSFLHFSDLPMHGQDVELRKTQITYPNGFTAVQPTDLTVEAGEFFSILGPSGCGKTTLLRAVSGFVAPSSGQVLIGGKDMTGIAPARRPTALIFQNLALFPLMKVWENVAFGLEARGLSKRARREKAAELLELVALPEQAEKLPGELSGGQRQRVAIARALAVEPAVLLLDEPLSALDLKLRSHMRAELRAIQKRTGVTFIYITHDQGEALTMSDRIAVMNEGRIEQVGRGDDIYFRPLTAFAASFIGEANVLRGRVGATDGALAQIDTALGPMRARNPRNLGTGDQGLLFIRPEALRLEDGENTLTARFQRRDLEGGFANLFFESRGQELVAQVRGEADAPQGESVLGFNSADALILPDGPLARTGREQVALA